jgi:uncharacterized radical SAM protein YgiQ
MDARGWELDVRSSPATPVDHPSFGAAMIGRVLEAEATGRDYRPAGLEEHRVDQGMGGRGFCGVTAGNLDSMLSNYTAARHKRKEDVYSEGGVPGKRPNHAAVVYTQMCRRAFPGVPVILGGMEGSMRRVAHYDHWEDKLRPSIMADAKADILVYGMGEVAARGLRGDSARATGTWRASAEPLCSSGRRRPLPPISRTALRCRRGRTCSGTAAICSD